jgi:hypothetical protein
MPKTRQKPKPKYLHWDYRVEYRYGGDDLYKELHENFGPDGWELCGIIGTVEPPPDMSTNWPAVIRYYFKRSRK